MIFRTADPVSFSHDPCLLLNLHTPFLKLAHADRAIPLQEDFLG